MFARLRPATREVLQRVAVAGASFDTDEFVALSGLAETEAFGHLDDALAARIVEPASAGYRFRHCLIRDALTSDVPEHRRRQVHRDTARRLVELGASPVRIGHHFLAAGAGADAVPHLLRAAETESAVDAYRDALALVDAIRPHAAGPCRTRLLSLRADLLTAIGDPMAGPAYPDALGGAGPADARRLRARLANSAVMAGDLATAAAALDGLDTDGGADDADILLARGKYAFFAADFDAARIAAEQAQRLILAGERNWQVLDLSSRCAACSRTVRINGSSRWEPSCTGPGRIRAWPEPSSTATCARPRSARTGPHRTPRSWSWPATCAGPRNGAGPGGPPRSPGRCPARRHAGAGAPAGPGARSWPSTRICVFGTMIRAATSLPEAVELAERAESMLGWDDFCQFCSIMLAVPAAIACARDGDLPAARSDLAAAERSAVVWRDTAWEAALAEAQAAVAAAGSDPGTARTRLQWAAGQFQQAGQPLDARPVPLPLTGQAGGANSSRAMLSGSRNDRPEP